MRETAKSLEKAKHIKKKPSVKVSTNGKKAKTTMNSNVSIGHLTRDTRTEMIEKSAYQLAKNRGFVPGHELDDWLAAEFEVDQRLIGNGFM